MTRNLDFDDLTICFCLYAIYINNFNSLTNFGSFSQKKKEMNFWMSIRGFTKPVL